MAFDHRQHGLARARHVAGERRADAVVQEQTLGHRAGLFWVCAESYVTGSIVRPSTPPAASISSIASNVALIWVCSIADVTPVWENSTPTRQLSPLSLIRSISAFGSECLRYKLQLTLPARELNIPTSGDDAGCGRLDGAQSVKTTVFVPLTIMRSSRWQGRRGQARGTRCRVPCGRDRPVMSVADALHVLLDDRPFVEIRGHVMGGGADQLHAARIRLMIGFCALEAGQERVMNVDAPACQFGAEAVRRKICI